MNQMLDPHQNSICDQPWSVQIENFQLDVAPRTLRAAFNQRKPRASRFKKARVRALSQKNKRLRIQYGEFHQHHKIENYWQYVHFTDKAHLILIKCLMPECSEKKARDTKRKIYKLCLIWKELSCMWPPLFHGIIRERCNSTMTSMIRLKFRWKNFPSHADQSTKRKMIIVNESENGRPLCLMM